MIPFISKPWLRFGVFVLLVGSLALSLSAQDAADRTDTDGSPAQRLDADLIEKATERWEQEIRKLEKRDAEENDPDDAILFIGSSSIRLWDQIAEDIAPFSTIQRGYGGSRYSDVAVFAPRLLRPHQYRALAIFVANDVTGSDSDHTPQQVIQWLRSIVDVSRGHQPDADIFVIEITPSASRYDAWPKIREVNAAIREFCLTEPKMTFIPTAQYYLDKDNRPRNELFRDDRLHLNRDGYRLWAKLIKRRLHDFLPESPPAEESAEPLDIGSRLELFVDEFLTAEMIGDVHQHLHEPTPQEVVLVTDAAWEGNTSAYFTIFQDGDLYRMYYRGSHADEGTSSSAHPEVTCYAESRDGIHWTKPELDIVEYEGSKQNNIILKGLGSHCFVAFKDQNPDCPPEARYKGISRGRPDAAKGLYVFQSADAIHWSLIQEEPVITEGAFDSQNLAFWDPYTERYVAYFRDFIDGVRAIKTCTSEDYVNWTDPVPLKYPAAPVEHLYTNSIRPYAPAPHIRIGFPTRFLPKEGSRVEPIFMSSRDGVTFHRWNDPVIPVTAPKDRDGNRSNYMANALVMLPGHDGEYAVYGTEAYYEGPDGRLRRFTYRVDGFVSIRSNAEGGDLVTKPLSFTGQHLLVNFATREGGNIRVQLESEDGTPLATSQPLEGDAIAQLVAWQEESDLASFADQPVRLRFSMKNADLYSIQFTQSPKTN